MKRKPIDDLTGRSFGLLKVLGPYTRKRYVNRRGQIYATAIIWLCECACGRQVNIFASALRGAGGYSQKSCGKCGMKHGPSRGTVYRRRYERAAA